MGPLRLLLLCLACSPVSALILGTGARARSRSLAVAAVAKESCDECSRLGDQQVSPLTEAAYSDAALAKKKIDSGEWWLCGEPAEDVTLTCFLAPDWMNLGEDKWVCTDALKAEAKHRNGTSKNYGEDSY